MRIAVGAGVPLNETIIAEIKSLAHEVEAPRGSGKRTTALDRVAHVVGIADSGGAGLSEETGSRF